LPVSEFKLVLRRSARACLDRPILLCSVFTHTLYEYRCRGRARQV